MDVRCEKCQTEYELDEAKVTEAGVTVKCTTCGNLFKVRRRASAPHARPSGPQPASAPPGVDGDKQWLIRSGNGEVRRFKELTTLQQWIVERKVTRECAISRTGDTWKPLGEIAELASFFHVVEQADIAARAAAESAGSPHKATLPFASNNLVPPARPPQTPSFLGREPAAGTPPPAVPPLAQVAPPPAVATAPTLPQMQPARAPTPPPAAAPVPTIASSEPSGPTGGLQGAPVLEPGWASGADAVKRTRAHMAQEAQDSHFGMGRVRTPTAPPVDDFSDLDEGAAPARSSKKLLFAVLAILALGGVAIWFFILRRPGGEPTAAQPAEPAPTQPAPVTPPTPGPVVVAPIDAGAPPAPAPAAAPAVDEALARLYDDTDAAWDAAEKALEKARVADPAADARVLAGMAFINSSWAQALTDDADAVEATDKRKAAQHRAEANRRLKRAETFAKEALAKAPKGADGLVAMADARRQLKGKTRDIDALLKAAGDHPEVVYVRAMLRLRDDKEEQAEDLLHEVVAAFPKARGREHLRARWRLALLHFDGKRWADAKAELDAILAAQPEHPRAKALAARIAAETDAASPPVAVAPNPKDPAAGGGAAGEPEPSSEDYDALLARAQKLHERSGCGEAMKYYEKALDARPSGVEALVGVGYCHLDAGQYGRAEANFRAALGVSPRYGDALIGMAETARFQKQHDKAIDYYQKYLDNHPTGQHAAMAKKWIEKLGGGEPALPPPTDPTPPPADPTPPPPDEKPPAPEPEKPPDPPAEKAPETPPAEPGATTPQ